MRILVEKSVIQSEFGFAVESKLIVSLGDAKPVVASVTVGGKPALKGYRNVFCSTNRSFAV